MTVKSSTWEGKLEVAIRAARREAVASGSWALRDAIAVMVAAMRMANRDDGAALRSLAAQAHAHPSMAPKGAYIEFPQNRRAGLDLLALVLDGRARDLKRARAAVREACEWVGIPLPAPAERERIARAVSAKWELKNALNAKDAARIVLKELGDLRAANAYKADFMRVKRKSRRPRRTSNR